MSTASKTRKTPYGWNVREKKDERERWSILCAGGPAEHRSTRLKEPKKSKGRKRVPGNSKECVKRGAALRHDIRYCGGEYFR